MLIERNLHSLRASNSAVSRRLKRGSKVALFGYPTYVNVGDLLILLGTLKFFENNRNPIVHASARVNTPDRLRLDDDVTLVFQGGGNLGDLYPEHQEFRERVIAQHCHLPVIILPQSIHFNSDESLEEGMRKLDKHPDLTLFVRDRSSLDKAAKYLGGKVELAPDMAHELWPEYAREIPRRFESQSPLFFMRRDIEDADPFPALLGRDAQFDDWETVNTIALRAQNRGVQELERLERLLGLNLPYQRLYFSAVRKRVSKVIQRMNGRDLWITSRLHGAILGALLGKMVVAVDNRYAKVSSYVETWRTNLTPFGLIRSNDQMGQVLAFADSLKAYRTQEEVISAYLSLEAVA